MDRITNDCFYCSRSEALYENRIFVKELRCSTLYLVKDQRHPGRCILAFRGHKTEFYDLTPEELTAYSMDLTDTTRALKDMFRFDKLNYGVYGDEMPHLHIHIVPKYRNTAEWGKPFRLDQPRIILSEEEYSRIVTNLQKTLPTLQTDSQKPQNPA